MRTKAFVIAALSAAFLHAVSCSKEAADATVVSEERITTAGQITIGGYASSEEAETKMAIDAKKGNAYPCVWSATDQIGIRTTAGNTVAIGTLTSGAGENYGTFSLTPGSTTPAEGETVRIVYPRTKMMSFISNTLATDQVQAGAGNLNNSISAYDFAVADITYTSGTFPGQFKLQHLLSYVRIALCSEKFAGTKLNSITMSCSGAKLSGDFSVNYSTLGVFPKNEGTADHVTVSFKDPIILNAAQKDIWLTVLPANLSGKTVTLTYNITTPDETFEVSTNLPGVQLEQGKAYSLDRTGFDPVPGFCPIDTRIRAGEGHAYGQANTFLIQCKDGSTYTGGSYRENPDIPCSVIIDYRVRGDRSTAVIPDGVTFGWANKTFGTTANKDLMYLPRYTDYNNSNVDPTGFTFDVDAENYTVTVTNVSAHAGSPILLMMKSGKILWGWTFWNIAADGTELAVETLNSYQLANMDIGQPTTNKEAWCANLSGSNPDPLWRMTYKYQWGRYLPTFWQSYWSLRIPNTSFSGNIPAIEGPVSMEEALAHPYGLIVPEASAVNNTITDWLDTADGALWGNLSADQNNVGKKTIYDPCPKGWRVPDFYNLQSRRYGESWSAVTTDGYYGWGAASGTFFPAVGVILNKIGNLSASEARIASAGGNNTGKSAAGGWWTNYVSQDAYYPASLGSLSTAASPAANPSWFTSGTSGSQPSKAHALAVRCMPDNDER